jgi:hypothetical protein
MSSHVILHVSAYMRNTVLVAHLSADVATIFYYYYFNDFFYIIIIITIIIN